MKAPGKAIGGSARHLLVAALLLITAAAILFEFSPSPIWRKSAEVLLYALREAPMGSEYVALYDNDSIEFGGGALRNRKAVTAAYSLVGDTIRIKYSEKDTIRRDDWLKVSGDRVERESNAYFKIGINRLGGR
jgi:hypothetical protein